MVASGNKLFNHKIIKMKTQLVSTALVAVAMLTGSFAYSNNAKPVKNSIKKEIAIESPFQKVAVGRDVQLVLLQEPGRSTILITGEENLVQSVNVKIDKGVLSINSKKNLKNKNIKIYVPVTSLSSLELDTYASVTTEGIVKLEGLKVLVHDGAKVNMNILGNFQIESDDNCDFVYEKYETSKVVYLNQ